MMNSRSVKKYFGHNAQPGTVQKINIPESTAYNWLKNGYIVDSGLYVLTVRGYNSFLGGFHEMWIE